MHGDFSRLTFANAKAKHYSGVLWQQGRLPLDADWNEQQAIHRYRAETEARHVIGQSGAPQHDPGFLITVEDDKLYIGKGSYYVDGILCENEIEAYPYDKQDDLEDPPDVKSLLNDDNTSTGLVYLDVWQRHITALDDDYIREKALGGPDTATRMRTTWQVKVLPLGAGVDPWVLKYRLRRQERIPEWSQLTAPTDQGMMKARIRPTGNGAMENQLYRVEIHKGGSRGEATFKWSRDNGSVAAAIEKIDGDVVTIADVGRDNELGFAPDQWVEITSDANELKEEPQPGELVQIYQVDSTRITLKTTPQSVEPDKLRQQHYKLRRWDQGDQNDPPATKDGVAVKPTAAHPDGWLPLENGIEVQFSYERFKSGDYWLIPARALRGEIEWPPYESPNTDPDPELPLGQHHYCPLALLTWQKKAGRGLVSFKDTEPVPDLALSWEVSAEGRSYTFKLDENVNMPDGTPLTAVIVKTHLEAEKDKITNYDSSKVVDEYTISVMLGVPNPQFLNELSGIAILDATKRLVAHDCRRIFPPLTAMEPGVAIGKVSLNDGTLLKNDRLVAVGALAEGIRVECDQVIDPDSVDDKPVCFVTLDLPYPLTTADQGFWSLNSFVGYQPLKLAAQVSLDKVDQRIILWQPAASTAQWLKESLFPELAGIEQSDRVLSHLALKSNFIHTPDKVYLAGGSDAQRGRDFEMRFWLTPEEAVPAAVIRVAAISGEESVILRAQAEGYMEIHPDVTVEIVAMPEQEMYRHLLSGSSDFDVYMLDVLWSGSLAGHFVNLYEHGANDVINEYVPAMVENNTVSGRLVAIPWSADAGLLYYRTDLLEISGFNPPETWLTLTEMAEEIQSRERAGRNLGFWGFVWQQSSEDEDLTCNTLEWIASNGGGIIVSPEEGVTINNPGAVVAALELAAEWVNTISPPGAIGQFGEYGQQIWLAGKAAFMRNWTYAIGESNNPRKSDVTDKFAVAPLPAGAAGHGAATLGGWQLGVSKYSEHPDVAAQVTLFLASAGAQKDLAIEFYNFYPAVMSVYLDQDVLRVRPFMTQIYEALKNAVARPSTAIGPKYRTASELVAKAVKDVLAGQTSAPEAVENLEAALKALLTRIR
jgi:trehalose/maltose transport system substrate-binding protein